MQSWQTVIVCVVVTLVSQGALGHPRAIEESGSELLKVKEEDVDPRQRQGSLWISPDNTNNGGRKHDRVSEEEPKKIFRSTSQEEEEPKKISTDEMKQVVPREFLLVKGGEEGKNEKLLGSTATGMELGNLQAKNEQKGDDTTRSKKSTDMRELGFRGSPATTVCIHVRSGHPEVMCGTAVGDENKDSKTSTPSARYAFPPASSQSYYIPMMAGREQVPEQFPPPSKQSMYYMRVSPQDIDQSRPLPASGKQPQKGVMPQQMPSQGPAGSPKAARGQYGMIRTQPEDDNSLKSSEGTQPAAPFQPIRIIPQNTPASVVVHKQYYQAAPLPSFATNLIAPSQTPFRFNCALQPEGAQFLQSYGSPVLRNVVSGVLPGYIPVGGETIYPDVPSSRMAQGPAESQAYYYDPQGRAAQPEEMMADPWMGSTFVGEDGRLYKIDDSQARSAADDQWEQENLRASSPSSMSLDDIRSRYYQQEEQLRQSSETLSKLQKQLNELQQRSAEQEEGKKKPTSNADLQKESQPPVREPTSETEEPKKSEQNKNIKRHSSNRHNMRK